MCVCVPLTGCRDAASQTFMELPCNPVATKKGKCGAVMMLYVTAGMSYMTKN